jgi:hypothetical protein
LAIIEAIADPDSRARALLAACDALPASDGAGRRGWLDRALLAARAIPAPG